MPHVRPESMGAQAERLLYLALLGAPETGLVTGPFCVANQRRPTRSVVDRGEVVHQSLTLSSQPAPLVQDDDPPTQLLVCSFADASLE
jgi:hypothetical protein